MDNVHLFFGLLAIGIGGHLFMRKSLDIGEMIRSLLCNSRGEGEAGGEVKFTTEQQAFFDKALERRVGEIKAKYEPIVKEVDDLKKFKTEFEQSKEKQTQDDLVKAKKYEEAEGNLKKQISDLSTKLSEKDLAIKDRDISNSLTNEISKQGGFTEEVLAMIKSSATVDANGLVVIKSRDANGVESNVSVADGVKKFLTERPHLVKASFKPGAGSGGGEGGTGAGGGGNETLAELNQKLLIAKQGTDLKLRSELTQKIKAKLAEKGVNR